MLKNLFKRRIPKAQVPLIKSQLRTQNTISFLNSPSSTELVMFYWCIISGRWTNLISCHQGLKSCSGSSSKERVFLEGCPDTLSLLYYFPYSSSQSNYSDKSLKELTALPGKMEPQVRDSSPSSWTLSARTCHCDVNNCSFNGSCTWQIEFSPNFISFVCWGSQLLISQDSHILPDCCPAFSCLDSCTLTFASSQGVLPQILELGVGWLLDNWFPTESLEQSSETGHSLPEFSILFGPPATKKSRRIPQQLHFDVCVCLGEKPLHMHTREQGWGCFRQPDESSRKTRNHLKVHLQGNQKLKYGNSHII